MNRGSPLPWHLAVLALAGTIAIVSSQPYAGGWNDGSRLATVECLVDEHTLAIDHSIFVQVPPRTDSSRPFPYDPEEVDYLQAGTGDKLWIGGHFYSDKSPVPALLLAGVYQVLQTGTGLTARNQPGTFCYWLTLFSSGLAYVAATWCIFQLSAALRLSLSFRLLLTASFALTSVALPYVRHVNNHSLLLGVTAALMLGLVRLAETEKHGPVTWLRLCGIGALAGLGYAIDLGAGPVLLVCTFAVVAFRCRRLSAVVLCGLAALPWLVLHHAVNYATGGTFKPANAVPEYFQWPGCGFTPENLTGSWHHASFGDFLLYAAGLLVGKRGFLGHNLVLFLALPALVFLLRRRIAEVPELLFAAACCGGIWLAYALTSTNSSGLCCSIRWFVPFLAPGYYVLAVYLREQPRMVGVFLLLSGWGLVMAGLMWWQGPWVKHMVPYYWPLQAAALVSVIGYWRWQRRIPGGDPWFAGCLSWCRRFTWLWSLGSSRPTS
jgi:hypothetical protein